MSLLLRWQGATLSPGDTGVQPQSGYGDVAIDSLTVGDAETFAPIDALVWPGSDVVVLADPAVLAAGELGVSGRAVGLTFTWGSEDPPERVTIEKVHVLLKPALGA